MSKVLNAVGSKTKVFAGVEITLHYLENGMRAVSTEDHARLMQALSDGYEMSQEELRELELFVKGDA